ncbi:hypothetical protein BLOT_009810 [Blomia tropicalis]|nr:hypothetical protein BLOT_016790 [Blomia tropicalis]KAI2800785.1 hypothetical protein BLOT_012357 [Blomia tropicalis]KAI2801871.1 hypothetical protein BLOT_009689 [Blomia tropicalis]KAI2802055.1 hypothetical protein BLOT_010247 [Blomia tropicalis]KAI2802365.1 hypothetical protein BLOT_009810 [Blomia tropicalis]
MAYNLWEPKNDEINETIDEVKRNERRTKRDAASSRLCSNDVALLPIVNNHQQYYYYDVL